MAPMSELEWLLTEDAETTISQLIEILTRCDSGLRTTTPKQYDIVYRSQNQLDVIKVNATLEGYKITSADINIKLSNKHPIKTCIKSPFCWRLTQLQDSINHLNDALDLLKDHHDGFQTPEELLHFINSVMNSLQKSRTSILIPKKILIEELHNSQNMQSISPALPLDFAISFFVQAPNLIYSLYQSTLNGSRPQVKAQYQAEVVMESLAEMMAILNLGLQNCQQLKEKIQTLILGE